MEEFKIVSYLLIFTFIFWVICRYISNKDKWGWDSFQENTDMGNLWYLLKTLWIIYIVLRWMIYPFSIWWFK